MKAAHAVFVLLCFSFANAQQRDSSHAATQEQLAELKSQVEGMNETLIELKNVVDALREIKVSGYIQTQFQVADGDGISTFAGGNFPTGVHSRFLLRRGRVKVAYDNDISQYVLQLDATQSGISVKDVYVWLKEPWYRTIRLTAGIFNRPFGFEIGYSSSSRESPERSILFQTLFPGERDLGVQLEVSSELEPLSYFNLKAGVFNGTGPTASENDNYKDFIGRAGFQLPFQEEGFAIDGGVSLYSGKVRSNSRAIYTVNTSTRAYSVDSSLTNAGAYFDRSYLGAELQVYYDSPFLGGLSIRAEYIAGEQPGTATSNSFYNPGSTITPLYRRNFSGWYVTFVQNIGLNNQFVLKYDELDPNTDVQGAHIGAPGSNLTVADINYSTLGIGWIYHWDANIKLVLYYDVVTNEKVNTAATESSLIPFKDNIKDNVFTARIQYRF